jgi:hypothetical protein
MNSLIWIVGIGVFAIIALLGVMFSPQQKRKRRRRKEHKELPRKEKDWEAIALRRENYIQRLKDEIARLLREQKQKDEHSEAFKAHIEKLNEKLKLEQQWRQKEEQDTGKEAGRTRQLKEDLMKAEENLGKEHSANIRMNREIEAFKKELDGLKKEKMDRSLEIMKLKSLLEETKKELREQKKISDELSRKKEDAQWVAKSDFDKLQQQLREKEKEFDRIVREASGGQDA